MNPRGMRNSPRLFAAAGLALWIGPVSVCEGAAAESVRLQVDRPAATAPGAAGSLRVTGRFNHPRFSVDDVGQLAVSIGGNDLPFEIMGSSIGKDEFGEKVVSVRLSFAIERSALEAAGFEVTFRWGSGVRGRGTRVERLQEEGALAFTWDRSERPAGGDGEESFASLEVFAESGAENTYLWYLLPMGLLLALLTVRKFVAA